MTLNITGLTQAQGTNVKGLEDSMLNALQKCRDKVAGNKASDAMTRWFGANSPALANQVKGKVARMRSVLNNRSVKCLNGEKTRPATENALATHYPTGLFDDTIGESDRVARMLDTDDSIHISPNFRNLPKTASGVASSWAGQDQLETLLHELSHIVLGTKDEKLDDNTTTAYGGENARLLAVQSAARAQTNAENWGFFIEECGT